MVYNKVKLMGKNLSLERGVLNWIKSSDYDIKTAEHMFGTGRYIKEFLKWLKRDMRLRR